MMKRKIKLLLLVCFMFLVSGCSAEYNLVINDESMTEDINAIFSKESESELASRMETIRRTSFYNLDTRENEYYTFNKSEDENNIILNYRYKYSGNDLYKSEAASRCYYKRVVNVTDQYITINTDDQVACLYKDGQKEIDNITVNIKTRLKVLENNADSVNDDTYTWYINDSNYTNKPISIKLEKGTAYEKNIPFELVFLMIGFIVVVFIIYLVVRRKYRKNNKIK